MNRSASLSTLLSISLLLISGAAYPDSDQQTVLITGSNRVIGVRHQLPPVGQMQKGMVEIEDSIAGMINVFANFTIEQNGRSYRHDGSETTLASPPR